MAKPFRFKQFTIQQDSDVFKVGTDGCLLGCLVELTNAPKILEVGTGTGVISLMLAQRFENVLIKAIDINLSAIALTSINFNKSPWASRLSAIPLSFLDLKETEDNSFDLIISNPPFFKNSIKNANDAMSLARHESDLSLETFFKQSKKLLKTNGKIALILPFQRRSEFETLLNRYDLFEIRCISIKPKAEKNTNRFISEFGKFKSECTRETIVIYEANCELTSQAKDIFSPFYLRL